MLTLQFFVVVAVSRFFVVLAFVSSVALLDNKVVRMRLQKVPDIIRLWIALFVSIPEGW